ncbi:unnamed protein product [Rotaria sordida]|uniref:Uncharacterized protein n=1 Tax=Rotaria sordida TaxID=392033 RepID=A0A815H547_9BILA|nr:unnamed protein product [Rotaria sordida]CAF3638443.1 unnamed protein product [Rotaria sordida]
MELLNDSCSNSSDGLSLVNYIQHSLKDSSIRLEIIAGLCLAIGIITAICQINKQKLIRKINQFEKNLDDYSYRDLFYFFINPEFHIDKLHLAKEFSERMHYEASQYMMNDHEDDPDFPDHFTYIKYDKEKVQQRLDYIFQRLLKEKYLDWCDAGQPVSSDSRYWWAKTKLHFTTYLIQREPYHLTDGIWLRGLSQGPMSAIEAKLFSIYIDELGNGDPEQNHPNVYLNVLKNLGLYVPPIHSREFVDQQSILDISFKKPLLTLTTSLFPRTFQPEILGYTLWLETTSTSEHVGLRKILERYDLNPKFSLLHTAIDNSLNGHGKYARDAVEEYLDHIQKTQGEQAVQEHWKRIWTGYVAYGTTGNIDDALKKLFKEQEKLTPRGEFIELIKKKSCLAQKMHGSRRIGPHNYLLNEMFASDHPEILCDELENSDMISKGHPEKSKLLSHAVSFQGPMYQIFNADELSIITRWILSLSQSTVNDMISVVVQRRRLSEQIESDIKLKLPDQSERLLRELLQGKPNDLLWAFRATQWTIPDNGEALTEENVDTCPLMKSISEHGILEEVFNQDKQIIRQWLLDGSPTINETFQQSTDQLDQIEILSHKFFKFQY